MSYRQNSFFFEILLIMCFKLPDNKIEYGRSALHNLDRINHVWIGLPVWAEVWKNLCYLKFAYQSCQSDPEGL